MLIPWIGHFPVRDWTTLLAFFQNLFVWMDWASQPSLVEAKLRNQVILIDTGAMFPRLPGPLNERRFKIKYGLSI